MAEKTTAAKTAAKKTEMIDEAIAASDLLEARGYEVLTPEQRKEREEFELRRAEEVAELIDNAIETAKGQKEGEAYVCSGRETFAPIPYHTFEVGPISLTTPVREAESYQDAIERARAEVGEQFQAAFEDKMASFFSRLAQVDAHMIEAGMQTRSQQETFGRNSSTPAPRPAQGHAPPADRGDVNSIGFYGDPKARGPQDMPSDKQMGMLDRQADAKGVDLEAKSQEIYGCALAELNRMAVSKLIDHLMGLPPAENIGRGGEYDQATSQHSGPPPAQASQGYAPVAAPIGPDDDIPF